MWWRHLWKNQTIWAFVVRIVHCSWMVSEISLFLDYKVGRRLWVQSSNQVNNSSPLTFHTLESTYTNCIRYSVWPSPADLQVRSMTIEQFPSGVLSKFCPNGILSEQKEFRILNSFELQNGLGWLYSSPTLNSMVTPSWLSRVESLMASCGSTMTPDSAMALFVGSHKLVLTWWPQALTRSRFFEP